MNLSFLPYKIVVLVKDQSSHMCVLLKKHRRKYANSYVYVVHGQKRIVLTFQPFYRLLIIFHLKILIILLNQANQCLHHLLKYYLECQYEVDKMMMNDELEKNVKEKNVVIDPKKKDDGVVNKIGVMKNDELKNGELKNDEPKNDEPKNEELTNDELTNAEPKNEEPKNEELKKEDIKNNKNKNGRLPSAASQVLTTLRLIVEIRLIVMTMEEE